MSTDNAIQCGCCDDDMSQDAIYVDPDLNAPVCPSCKIALRWASALLRRRTPKGVSITGMHGPQEQPIPWDPKIAEDEYAKWLKTQEEGQ